MLLDDDLSVQGTRNNACYVYVIYERDLTKVKHANTNAVHTRMLARTSQPDSNTKSAITIIKIILTMY